MPPRVARWVGLLWLLLTPACFTDMPTQFCRQGSMGCHCAEGTCGSGLTCSSNYCIIENCVPGSEFCSCDDDGQCEGSLECIDASVCRPPEQGGSGDATGGSDGCVPHRACGDPTAECGTVNDGCATIECGACPPDQLCQDGRCEVQAYCGNGQCDAGESCSDCGDCGCAEDEVCFEASCCVPDCSPGACGPDGCGGTCGDCAAPGECAGDWCFDCACAGGICQLDATCCTPSCIDRECGNDGCGGSCGLCDDMQQCVNGLCEHVALCGDAECDAGESCTTCPTDCGCPVGETCQLDGTCCTPSCPTQSCAADGCGGSCGAGDCAPGQVQMQPCGTCGMQSRTCSDEWTWGAWDACTGEGTCTPGEVQDQPCGNCGTQSRTCDNLCMWPSWGLCMDEGVCTPDDIIECADCYSTILVCNESCAWDPPFCNFEVCPCLKPPCPL